MRTAGGQTTFSVSARGTEPLSYQWLRDGSPIAGATASNLTLPSTRLADAKSLWSVLISNNAGSVTSAAAHLSVSGMEVMAGSISEFGAIDGPAAAARFYRPIGVVLDPAGNAYVSDANRVRKIGANGIVSTVAGPGAIGPGASADFNTPAGIAIDASNNLYVADEFHHWLRKITPAGVVTTVLTPSTGFGDGRDDQFFYATGVAVDGSGNVYLKTDANTRKLAPSGVVTLIEGSDAPLTVPPIGTPVYALKGIAVDPAGAVLIAAGGCVQKIAKDNSVTTLVGSQWCSNGPTDTHFPVVALSWPAAIALDKAGNLFVADTENHVVRKITPSGVATIVAGRINLPGVVTGALPGGLNSPFGITVDANGALYVTSGSVVLQIVLP